jgi:hypothetical protein
MANVKFSDLAVFPLNAAPTSAQILVGYDLGASTNFAVSAQTLNEVTIPTLSNPGEFGFGATILKDFVTGAALTSGKLYQFGYDATGSVNQWTEANNTTGASVDSSGLLAICRNTTQDGSQMISQGIVRVADPGATWTASNNGNPVYVGATGLVTLIEPAVSNDTIRLVGYVVDGPSYSISLDVDNTYLLVR